MNIAFAIDTDGKAESNLSWESIKNQALLAEKIGFDAVFLPDQTIYQSNAGNIGCWESVALAGAVAAVTTTIKIGHSMFNAPYRPPTLVAKIAETLDEISGGRYIFGIGAGNTSDFDYKTVGVHTDKRYSRFAEAIEIIHGLLKNGKVDFQGKYWSANHAELVLRGPSPKGPPIIIAAWGPKMMRLAARYADGWNGWVSSNPSIETFKPMIKRLEKACKEVGRNINTLRRTLDIQVDSQGLYETLRPGGNTKPIAGTSKEIADKILSFKNINVDEVRCYVISQETPQEKLKSIESMKEIIKFVHES
jgi:alkanesulfonate monooxygenase SsuD/methylene tetrahydromethanopterin reductase-like flavin-dependent oxidoreductase (luciferase family)